jgi:hypothetical protein
MKISGVEAAEWEAKLQWTKPPEGDPAAAAHAARAPAPPLPSKGGGSSLWQQKKWEQPDWAGGWAPHRGARVGVEAGGVRGLGVGC